MKSAGTNQRDKRASCLSTSAGCLVSALLFPFSITVFTWLSFAVGPMGCALPNRCSASQQNVKAIVSLIVFLGGGLGIPIVTGIGVSKAIRKGVDVIEQGKSTIDERD